MKFSVQYQNKLYFVKDKHKPKRGCYEMMVYILEMWKTADIEKIYLYLSPQYRKELGGRKIALDKIKNHPLLRWKTSIFLERKVDEIKTHYYYKILFENDKVSTIKFTLERQFDWVKNKPLYDNYYNVKYYFHYRLVNLEEVFEVNNQTRLKKIIDYCRI